MMIQSPQPRRLLPALCAGIFLFSFGCSSANNVDDSGVAAPTQQTAKTPAKQWDSAQAIPWQISDLIGKHLILRSDDGGVEHSRFEADGKAMITFFETPNSPPVAPLLYWKIDSEGTLLLSIFEDMSKPNKHQLLARNGNNYIVRRNGKVCELEVEPSN